MKVDRRLWEIMREWRLKPYREKYEEILKEKLEKLKNAKNQDI